MSDNKHHEFWMVYGEQQRSPVYEHLSYDAAKMEAQRLARNNPDKTFYVLKAVRGFVFAQQPVTEVEIDPNELPF